MSTKSDSGNILNNSDAIVISGKIMVAVVILLSLVFVFVFMLHLYSKFSMWRVQQETSIPSPQIRRRHRHRRHRHLVFALAEDAILHGTQNVGLDPSVLKSIPVLVFQPHEFKEDLECAVCISELVEGEKFRALPHCNHGFHVDCIDMWFQSHSTCPLCRTLVTEKLSKLNNSTPSVRENVTENSESSSEAENPADVNTNDESSNFPTHVLVWGDQTQFSHTTEDPHCSSSSGSCSSSSESGSDSSTSSSSNGRNNNGVLVIDIPNDEVTPEDDDEMKSSSPMVARLRSIKKLLSRDKKSTSPCSPNSFDVEQA
ncbi:RING-H2 finger protein ATL60-like [Arachis stenosperma]|uniref:RING-H2 finger protein ATL60-like n=1 Tax=Arachis stenosperma TaxID=217475 RepID=UPI0025AD9C1D|nr:RING-H2 finger protein ATL60-like [Arachis stenosperma]